MSIISKKVSDYQYYFFDFETPDLQAVELPEILGKAVVQVLEGLEPEWYTSLDSKILLRNKLLSINNHLKFLNEYYTDGEYHYLPMDIEDDFKYSRIIIGRLYKYLSSYNFLFNQVNNLVNQLIKSERKLDIKTYKSGNNKDTKTYDNNIEGISHSKSANEISPIDANIDVINTPNNKNHNNFDSNTSKTGTDTIDYSIDENIDDVHTETSPEYFKEIIKIYEKYNVYDIIEDCFKRVIKEYNTSL